MEQPDDASDVSAQTLTVRDLPAHERPREPLRLSGPGQLSNPELIAILLYTGSPDRTSCNCPLGCHVSSAV